MVHWQLTNYAYIIEGSAYHVVYEPKRVKRVAQHFRLIEIQLLGKCVDLQTVQRTIDDLMSNLLHARDQSMQVMVLLSSSALSFCTHARFLYLDCRANSQQRQTDENWYHELADRCPLRSVHECMLVYQFKQTYS